MRNSAHPQMPRGAFLILYDGVCGLCNRFVRFLLKHDRADLFRFAPLASQLAKGLLARHGAQHLDTVCVVEGIGTDAEKMLVKSDAAILALRRLGGFWTLAMIAFILPRFVRDGLYDFIARRRYSIFGKFDTCPLPDAEARRKFLEP